MKRVIIASAFVIVLALGIASVTLSQTVEAKGIPKCWLNHDGTIKTFYLHLMKAPYPVSYPVGLGKAYCNHQAKNFL